MLHPSLPGNTQRGTATQTKLRCALLLGLALGPLASPLALAQTPPSAGELLQKIERDRQAPPPPKKPADTQLQQPEAAKPIASGTEKVVVKQFKFTGNTLFSQEELGAALQDYLKQPQTLSELHQAAETIANFYLETGYLVRTLLPKQDITEGIVSIQVIESSFSGARIDNKSKRLGLDRLAKTIEGNIRVGEPMSVKKLERALMTADDLPGVNVSGRLVAGERDNTTGVVVMATDEPLVYGQAALDNMGSYATGTTRYTVNAMLNGAMGLGDQGSAYTLHTQGTDFLRMAYSLPVGYQGARLGANSSYLKYRIVNGAPGDGTSTTVGLESTYPLVRSRPKNLNLVANLDHKAFDNRGPTGETTTRYSSLVFSAGLNWAASDSDGSSTATVTVSHGYMDLNGSPNKAGDDATTQVHGEFGKLRYSVSRTQNITPQFSIYGALSGQFASKNMDSSEKFYLGGPTAIRAYPNNEGSGSTGHLLSLELRQGLPNNLNLVGFYDKGLVTAQVNNNYAGAAHPNKMSYAGYGLALSWDGPNNLILKTVWARRVGTNPYPILATGNDQDGTKVVDRFWLSASISF